MNKFLVLDPTLNSISKIENDLVNLSDDAFFKDGSKSMTGNILLGNNSLAGGVNIVLENQASATNPPAGQLKLFSKTDDKLYIRNDTGTEIDLTSGGVSSVDTSGSVNGILLSGGPITSTGTIALSGNLEVNNSDWLGADLSIGNGGTGESTAQDAINALTDVASAGLNHVLTENGGNAQWYSPQMGVTSVGTANVNSNGLTLTGGPITGSGTVVLGGNLVINDSDWSGTDLSISNGGTGESTRQDAINALTDVASASVGQVLTKGNINFSAGWDTPPQGTVESISTSGTVNGIALSGGPIITTGTITLGGTLLINNSDWLGADLVIGNGGTGESTAQAAINSLTDVASASVGQILTKTGTDAVWESPSGGAGTVSSVGTTGSVNGIALSGGPITTTGTIALGGTLLINNSDWLGADLVIGNGGTGESTAQAAINSLTDVASASVGQILTKTGTDAVWETPIVGYASYYFAGNNTDTNGSEDNYSVITGTRVAGSITSNFSANLLTPNLQYTGTPTVNVRVSVAANWSNEDSSNNFCRMGVHKNGVVQSNLETRANLSINNDYPRNVSLSGFLEMTTNDTINCRVLNEESSTDDILVSYLSLNIEIIG